MRQPFDRYFSDYAEAFNAFDPDRIASFFHCPCLMVSAGATVPLLTATAIRENMEALCANHRQQGFGRAVVAGLTLRLESEHFAIATVSWEVLRPDGSPLWRFGNTYNLVDSGPGWKIAVSTTHEDAA